MISEIRRRHCIVCGGRLSGSPLVSFEGMPASAQDIPGEEEIDQDRGIELNLYRCPVCGLVQFDCEPVAYYRDVIRSGGYSTTMKELREAQYCRLIGDFGLEGKKILEVGCGQGEFIGMLEHFPVRAFGIEHRKQLAELARAKGLKVFDGFPETPDTVLGTEGPYDAFLSFNFLEHQPEPGVMLDCISRNLAESGVGLITVPSLEYILRYNGYYELIRDHLAYYTFDTLRYLLKHHGFEVLSEEMINRDTLSVTVRKAVGAAVEKKAAELPGKKNAAEEGAAAKKTAEPLKGDMAEVSGLKASYDRLRAQMEELTEALWAEGKTLAMWGASHQGFTLAATTCLRDAAAYIIDSAPFKQGKFAPASHLPIMPPEHFEKEPTDVILIAAPGYTEEIAGNIRRRFGSGVQILTLRTDHIEVL